MRGGLRAGVVIGLSTIVLNTTGSSSPEGFRDWWRARGHTDAPIRGVCLVVAWPTLATSSLTPFCRSTFFRRLRRHLAASPACPSGYVAMGPMAVNQVTPTQMRAQISSLYLLLRQQPDRHGRGSLRWCRSSAIPS